jgi:hypothetical protein
MSKQDREERVEQGDVVVAGSVSALKDLAGLAPTLSELDLQIIHWYEQLVRLLAGPRFGDERGPAQKPPWVTQGPRIESVKVVKKAPPSYLIEGSGFATTREVSVGGRSARWQILSHGKLLIPIPEDVRTPVEIVVSTDEGDVLARLDATDSLDVE